MAVSSQENRNSKENLRPDALFTLANTLLRLVDSDRAAEARLERTSQKVSRVSPLDKKVNTRDTFQWSAMRIKNMVGVTTKIDRLLPNLSDPNLFPKENHLSTRFLQIHRSGDSVEVDCQFSSKVLSLQEAVLAFWDVWQQQQPELNESSALPSLRQHLIESLKSLNMQKGHGEIKIDFPTGENIMAFGTGEFRGEYNFIIRLLVPISPEQQASIDVRQREEYLKNAVGNLKLALRKNEIDRALQALDPYGIEHDIRLYFEIPWSEYSVKMTLEDWKEVVAEVGLTEIEETENTLTVKVTSYEGIKLRIVVDPKQNINRNLILVKNKDFHEKRRNELSSKHAETKAYEIGVFERRLEEKILNAGPNNPISLEVESLSRQFDHSSYALLTTSDRDEIVKNKLSEPLAILARKDTHYYPQSEYISQPGDTWVVKLETDLNLNNTPRRRAKAWPVKK